MSKNLTVGEIAHALGCDQLTAREYLREVKPDIDVDDDNLSEVVSRRTVIDLCAAHAGELIGRQLIRLLGETGELSDWQERGGFMEG